MPANPNPILQMVPIAAIFLIFYFLVMRPQQKRAKEQQKMLEGIKKGDRVLTNGGFYGVVVGFRGTDLELKIADNVKILLARSAVSQVMAQSQAVPAEASSGGQEASASESASRNSAAAPAA